MSTPKNDVEAWTATLEQGQPVSFAFSRGKTVGMIVACVVFILVGLLMAGSDSILWKIIGWIAVVLFLLGIIVQVRRLFVRAAALSVSPDGITMTTAKGGTVPWAQILDIHAVKQSSNVFIEIEITKAEADRQAAGGLGVAEMADEDGASHYVLWGPNGLAVNKPALCHFLEQEHAARTAA